MILSCQRVFVHLDVPLAAACVVSSCAYHRKSFLSSDAQLTGIPTRRFVVLEALAKQIIRPLWASV
jgi:hypothetical protein